MSATFSLLCFMPLKESTCEKSGHNLQKGFDCSSEECNIYKSGKPFVEKASRRYQNN